MGICQENALHRVLGPRLYCRFLSSLSESKGRSVELRLRGKLVEVPLHNFAQDYFGVLRAKPEHGIDSLLAHGVSNGTAVPFILCMHDDFLLGRDIGRS